MVAAKTTLRAGLGLGWRPETAAVCAARTDLVAFEVIAESLKPGAEPPPPLAALRASGRPVIPHGVGLGLGDAAPLSRARMRHLAAIARMLDAPFVSEHLAWVRADGLETEHLLPLPRTRRALDHVIGQVCRLQDHLPCPLVIENIAALFAWPDDTLAEADMLTEIVARTGVGLLVDVANLHANIANGFVSNVHAPQPDGPDDPYAHTTALLTATTAWLRAIPADAIVYLHVAGGQDCGHFRHDTHAHPVADPTVAMTRLILAQIGPRPVILERDDLFGTRVSFEQELDNLAALLPTGPWTPRFPSLRNPVTDARPDTPEPHLTQCQNMLIRAVMAGETPPAGFDPTTLERLRLKLQAKSAWVAARRARARPRPPGNWLTRLLSRR